MCVCVYSLKLMACTLASLPAAGILSAHLRRVVVVVQIAGQRCPRQGSEPAPPMPSVFCLV